MGAVTIGRAVLRHLTLWRYGATGWSTISLAGVAVDEELPRPKGAPVHALMPIAYGGRPAIKTFSLARAT